MCGIAGKVGSPSRDSVSVVRRMTDALVHRGPDGEGFWSDGVACLGHRRLAIIDVKGGSQPMHIVIHGEEHVIVFNGEIYNFQRLRNNLAKERVPWQTRSDTEVLLWLLATRGVQHTLSELCGMFAFAWWSRREQTLILARDRVGIKPLYYHHAIDGSLSFSSSLESIMTDSTIPRSLDFESLEYLLTLGYTPAPLTMYAGIRELPPGTYVTWRNGRATSCRYWEVDYNRRFEGSEEDATEQLNSVLNEVIRDHMVSDVPVASFLSGGLDSSTVVARARSFADDTFQCFTVAFPDAKYDESAAAASTAAHLGVPHSVIPMRQMPVDDVACQFVLKHVGQPFADSSALPMYLVSRSAREKATVVLSGDGGDELFAGYDEFEWAARIQMSQRVPAFVRRAILAALSHSPVPPGFGNSLRQLRKGLRYSLQSAEDLLLQLKTIVDPNEIPTISALFGPEGPTLRFVREYLRPHASEDLNRDLLRLLIGICLPGDMLRKVDSMSMAASIEVRVPLLDHRMIEFANSLPFSMKISGGTRKYLLRRAVQSELPMDVFQRPKWGFSIPLHRMFTPGFFQFCREMFHASDGYVRRWIGYEFLDGLVEDNEAYENRRQHRWSIYTLSHVLWVLVQLETWCQQKRVEIGSAPVAAL